MRSFGILPAAGLSVRMGEPKLLLPWGNSTIIEHVVATWQASQVDELVVVVRADDKALYNLLGKLDVHVVAPLLVALVVFVRRRLREREGISKDRLKT